MTHDFDKGYWQEHWEQGDSEAAETFEVPANPYLERELAQLTPGSALDAGCGAGAEALWLATRGWQVTGADISGNALGRAAENAAKAGIPNQVEWVEADLTTWQPGRQFDLVMTNYAHPTIPQLDFYEHISHWVAPGGTLLIVGHLHDSDAGGHGHDHGDAAEGGHGHDNEHAHGDADAAHTHSPEHPPAEATVTLADIAARFADDNWSIDTAEEHSRTLTGTHGTTHALSDVVVRATRRS